MPLNSFSSIAPAGVGEGAARTEAGKMEIAQTIPISTGSQQLDAIIRLKCKACDLVQLDFGDIMASSARVRLAAKRSP